MDEAPELPVTYTLRLSDEADPTEVTVVTPTFRRAFNYIDAYLATGEGEVGESGRALAIMGELGVGKTHLSRSLLEYIHQGNEDTIILRLDTPHAGMGVLFRHVLAEQFGKARLHDLIIDYYARVTVAELSMHDTDEEFARSLRDGLLAHTIDPRKVVEHFHLAKSALLGELRRRLLHLPEHSPYATALALMVMDDHVDAVWEWLTGGPVTPELHERGVTRRLSTVDDAYHALSVLAFLSGRMDRRLVLVIDEFEKLLGEPGPWRQDSVNAFDELVQVFIDTNSMLIFSGMSESLSKLPRGLLQRTRVLTPTPFSPGEAVQLLAKRGRSVGLPVAEALCAMSEGNPREALSLYRKAEAIIASRGGSVVTPALLRDAARQRYEVPDQQVTTATRRIIQEGGMDFRTDVALTGDSDPIDFWIPYGDGRAAVAVVITRSLLQESEDLFLRQRIAAAQATASPCEIIVVINGTLTWDLRGQVSRLIGRQPLLFDVHDFARNFRDLVDACIKRLGDSAEVGTVSELRGRLDRLSRQQSATQNLLDTLLTGVAALRATSVPSSGVEPDLVRLPSALSEQFAIAEATAAASEDLGTILKELFDSAVGTETRRRARQRLASLDVVELVGAAAVWRQLIDAFKVRVALFMERLGSRPLDTAAEEELRAICRTYDVTVQTLLPAIRETRKPDRQSADTRDTSLGELGQRILYLVKAGLPQ
ncbi:hypothetical protein [Nonomuraea sp. NPDC050540]|uniref:hypothetical protein n=1 Tax=Nonomuraea sp. NPDC050540 TaxID=3364367 RepID=UPI0037B30FFC